MTASHMLLLSSLCLSACVRAGSPGAASPIADAESGDKRLPNGVAPLSYSITLNIDPASESGFEGQASIRVRLDRPMRQIRLHGRDFTEVKVFEGKQAGVAALGPSGGMTVTFPEPLAPGERELRFTWRSVFTEGPHGIYRRTTGADTYVFTQFQATDARRAFPCFDEPGFKTPFELTVTAPAALVVASNTPVAKSSVAGANQTVHFAPTKPLPTYLVALVIGPFDVVPAGEVEGVPLRVLTPRGRGEEAKFAASRMEPILLALRDYFGRGYPYEKLDLVAMTDAWFWGMENAGLITFIETRLLKDPRRMTAADRVGLEVLIAHEVAHQWFGNLVTLAWWDDVWLNEAFASWMSTKVLETTMPEARPGLKQVQTATRVMDQDWFVSTRAVQQPVKDGAGILTTFDSMAYDKGEAVVRMLERWLGAEAFRAGVRAYVNEHAWGSATTGDLFAALERASGQPVARVARTFLAQPGTPFVDVAVRCNAGKGEISLTQSRWRPEGANTPDAQWLVPVCFRWSAGSTARRQCTLLAEKPATVAVDGCVEWIHPNDGESGYYHWRIDEARLAELLEPGRLTPEEEAALPSHISSMVGAGTLDAGVWMSAIDAFSRSPHREVVEGAFDGLQAVHDVLGLHGTERDRQSSAEWTRAMFGERARSLGFQVRDGESLDDGLLRPQLLWAMAVQANDGAVRLKAKRLAEQWLADPASVPRTSVIDAVPIAATYADDAFYEKLLLAEAAATDPDDLGLLAAALGATDDPVLLRRSLDLTLTKEIRRKELMIVLSNSTDHPTHDVALEWLTTNYVSLAEKIGSDDSVAKLPRFFATSCSSKSRQALSAFFRDPQRHVPGLERILDQTLETIAACERRSVRLAPQMQAWFRKREASGSAPAPPGD